jgi:Holliday junction resolvase
LSQYAKGRAYEYKTLRILRKKGWFCHRSAASHSPVDVFAGKGGKTLLIQVKSGRGRVSKDSRKTLIEWGKAFNARVEIWSFKKGASVEVETVLESP